MGTRGSVAPTLRSMTKMRPGCTSHSGPYLTAANGMDVPEFCAQHALWLACARRARAVHVPCMCRACPVHVPCMCRACAVHVPCTWRACGLLRAFESAVRVASPGAHVQYLARMPEGRRASYC